MRVPMRVTHLPEYEIFSINAFKCVDRLSVDERLQVCHGPFGSDFHREQGSRLHQSFTSVMVWWLS
jgi:hypothetical protein